MRLYTIIFLILLSNLSFGQRYTFVNEFVSGTIILNDSTEKQGYLKWSVHQNERLKFKTTPESEIEKLGPDEISGFRIDSIEFRSLFDLNSVSAEYVSIGRKTTLKQTFGEIVNLGKFEIYKIYVTGYNPISGTATNTLNFVFKKDSIQVCYPYGLRMRQKKYEKAKIDLIEMFKSYQPIVQLIENYDRTEKFEPIIEQIIELN